MTARSFALAVVLSLTACSAGLPGLIPPTPSPVTVLRQTPTQPAPTQAVVLSTASPTTTAVMPPTFTPIATLTAEVSPAPTTTPVVEGSVTPTATQPATSATLAGDVGMDKLPRDTVYKPVHIQNQSHSQTDISLHATTVHHLHTIIEVNNVRNTTVQAPDGDYIYVVYVGGRMMTGSFSLLHVPSATITVYSDRVTVH